jgi:hypothetical protein
MCLWTNWGHHNNIFHQPLHVLCWWVYGELLTTLYVFRSLVFCVIFCRSLFVLLFLFFWPLCCLSFNLRFLITFMSSIYAYCGPHSAYLLTLPLFAGVSRVRALSPAWNGSHARETLISRTTSPQQQKSSTIKSWPTFCDQYFWKFPIWNSRVDEKRREIRMVKVFKWYPVIDLFDTFTGKLGHGD